MLKIQNLRRQDYKAQKWRNGLGETLEVAIEKENPFGWRISIARVAETTALSDFAGYDRVLVLLEGGPGLLSINNRDIPIKEMQPVRFSGDQKGTIQMRSAGRDFNLFCLRERAKGNVYPTRISRSEEMQFPITGTEHFLFCVTGEVEWRDRESDEKIILAPHELLQLSRINKKKEYLNQIVIGRAEQSVLLWIVVHVN
ncbi:MAG: hypothetical protein EB078_03750 [Proteobacteria bacterium]|nr:hypothetical protein [Pseudomonadota bacterium]NDC23958.1 hypothetical protein [Pseudomonadota bacterium]NDD03997.1 hypothetical protein [Pseudomonadota bacterium]NDG26906.1 hypothetical protein [Pseudomonadota bacterium]